MDSWNQRHPPVWRKDGRRDRTSPVEFVTRAAHATSAVVALCAFFPGRTPFGQPISLGLRDGDFQSWAIMGSLIASLTLFAGLEATLRRWISGGVIVAIICCLTAICVTDPLSMQHLNAFSFAIMLEAAWFLGVGIFAEQTFLTSFSLICLGGAVVAMIFVGVGERFLILAGLGGINMAIRLPRTIALA